MSSRIRHVTIDCRDPYTIAAFWADLLGFVDEPDNPNEPGDPEALIVDPTGRHPGLLFVPVPEPKSVKNRLHLDVQPSEPRDAAVEAALRNGATLVADHRRADGTGWVVLADPEGNELCIERSAAERGEPEPVDSGSNQPYPEGSHTAGERELLVGMLEWYRAALLRKLDGVSAVVAGTSPVRSGTTIGGLVKHLALVEDDWLHVRFAGRTEPEPWASAPWDDDPDWEFHTGGHDGPETVMALYLEACERSRAAIAGRSLDELAAAPATGPFTLRFALVHLIEETARHLGHVDILREYLDGTTGE